MMMVGMGVVDMEAEEAMEGVAAVMGEVAGMEAVGGEGMGRDGRTEMR
jgi:hypothetical protein